MCLSRAGELSEITLSLAFLPHQPDYHSRVQVLDICQRISQVEPGLFLHFLDLGEMEGVQVFRQPIA